MWDPVLNADPLNAVSYSHFLWASVLFGYLTYDTLYRCVESVPLTQTMLHEFHCLQLFVVPRPAAVVPSMSSACVPYKLVSPATAVKLTHP